MTWYGETGPGGNGGNKRVMGKALVVGLQESITKKKKGGQEK